MLWRRKWQPTPVFLPGESQARGSLVGCCLWGCTVRTKLKQLSSRSSWGLRCEYLWKGTSLVAQMVKNLSAMQETEVPSLGWKDPLEKEMATHSSILTWEILWTNSRISGRSLFYFSSKNIPVLGLMVHRDKFKETQILLAAHTTSLISEMLCPTYSTETQRRKLLLLQYKARTSLVVQRRRLCTPNAGGLGSIPGQI